MAQMAADWAWLLATFPDVPFGGPFDGRACESCAESRAVGYREAIWNRTTGRYRLGEIAVLCLACWQARDWPRGTWLPCDDEAAPRPRPQG
jgi:hypothetical protein